MTKLRAFGLPILAGIVLSFGSVAQAGILYNSLEGPLPTGSDPISGLGPLADSFSTGAAATTLGEVQLYLSGNPASSGTTSVELLSSNSGPSPGPTLDLLGSISDSSLTTGGGTVAVTGLSIPLLANTRYWIELVSTPNSTAAWSWTSDTTGWVGVAGEFWSNGLGVTLNGAPFMMQVSTPTVSAVPEPSTLTLGILGIGTLVVLRRRVFR